jgi:non-canonical (house-cleaning) NTP pyrophosphatase
MGRPGGGPLETIYVAVGSKRRPKLMALREALAVIGPMLDPRAHLEVVKMDVLSGVRHTPLSREEMMEGARLRAEALVGKAPLDRPCQYFVGMEGGVDVITTENGRQGFLQNWACVMDGKGRSVYGQSGSLLLPEVLAHRVMDEGVELAAAIDAFAGGHGIRDAEGTWGVLTRNVITRQDAFRIALINAFAPFFNAPAYRDR